MRQELRRGLRLGSLGHDDFGHVELDIHVTEGGLEEDQMWCVMGRTGWNLKSAGG